MPEEKPMQSEFIEQLTKEGEAALREAIGGRLGQIFSPSFRIRQSPTTESDANSPTITTSTVSIPIAPRKYLVIKNDWADTPKEYLDYYFLSVAISGVPHGLTVVDDPVTGDHGIKYPSSSLWLPTESIRRISVYEFLESGECERVKYDAAIVFEREDSSVICFRPEQSISGSLEILTHYPDIEKYLNNPDIEEYQTLRLRLDFS